MSKQLMVINILCFQLLWWACVLSPLYALQWLVLALCLLFAALHLQHVEGWRKILPLLMTALLGCVFDQMGYLLGMVDFPNQPPSPTLIPVWMIALWLAFACTLDVSLRWLQYKPVLAFVLGAVFGPLAYWGAAEVGVVALPKHLVSMLWLGLGWAILLPIMLRIRASDASWSR